MAMAVLKDERRLPEPPQGGKMLRAISFVVLGALLGYAYHRFVGCRTGACPITANPYVSTVYGAVTGYLAACGVA
jgi:hypothetical protein